MPDPLTLGLAAAGIGSALGATAVGQIEGKRNRRFQRNMSNTAHRREMADLKAAGLNPLLTGKYGGSSTPSGGQAAPAKAIEGAVSSAVQYQGVKNQSKLIDAQTQTAITQANLNNANSAKAVAEANEINRAGGRKQSIFPTEVKQLKQAIKASKTLQSKQKREITALIEEFKKLQVERRLWDSAGQLIPKANTIVEKVESMKNLPSEVYQYFKRLIKSKKPQQDRQKKADERLKKAKRKKQYLNSLNRKQNIN